MSYIPDCRNDEYYNAKYLDEKDKAFLAGFDWCLEMAVDNFFDNHFNEFDYNDEYIDHILRHKAPDFMRKAYEFEHSFDTEGTGVKSETRSIETYADYIRSKIIDWVEMGRDELITSMLDNYGEEKYEQIRAEVDGQSEKKN